MTAGTTTGCATNYPGRRHKLSRTQFALSQRGYGAASFQQQRPFNHGSHEYHG
jgi:hypothetical protein